MRGGWRGSHRWGYGVVDAFGCGIYHTMIIASSTLLSSSDITKTCWSRIRRFHDVSFVAKSICEVHNVPARQHKNVEKQAIQIKQCLVQAKEYFDASQAVSLATKPVLLYYSIMSLALAEILFKQDGGSSLDKARGRNAHHGLDFKINQPARNAADRTLAYQASQLRATPVSIAGTRRGTFELWHQSSREAPLCGEIVYASPSLSSVNPCSAISAGPDKPFPVVPDDGLSLLDCLLELPTMHDYVRANDLMPLIVRGSVKLTKREAPQSSTLTIIIHPGRAEALDGFYSQIYVKSNDIQHIDVRELNNGLILDISMSAQQTPYINIPHGATVAKDRVLFSCKESTLNEFGLFYVSMYIAGNYARYYPDRWLPDIEKASPIALAIEELISHAEERLPLLALNELSQTYHVPD